MLKKGLKIEQNLFTFIHLKEQPGKKIIIFLIFIIKKKIPS